jgi:hypothetical protein
MYVFAPNQTVATYPYSFADLRRAHPQVSFPSPISDEELARWNVFSVLPVAPGHDTITQNAVESTPVFVNGSWQQSWQITAASAEQIQQRRLANADYVAFWDALLISPVYQSIRTQALTTPAVLVACTEFIAAISDAKAGRANAPAIQACINYLLQAGTFTTEEVQSIDQLLVAGNLEQIYSLEVQ